jgi:cell division protein FtsB
MNALSILEEKVAQLVGLVNELKKENVALQAENALLLEEVRSLETSVLQETKALDQLHQEKEATKAVVDDLIRNINALVSNEVQP